MQDKKIGTALILVLLAVAAAMTIAFGQTGRPAAERAVAVTFDDLPSSTSHDVSSLRTLTERLLQTLKTNNVPVIGFVNERKLYQDDKTAERAAILKMWLDAGFELGNHTYSHMRLYNNPLEKMKEDVILGEKVTTRLLADKGMRMTYFRHPTLNTGPDLATKTAFESFLSARGYIVAPVTIDNSDWIFARVYSQAKAKGDVALMKRVSTAYAPYMEEMTAFYEKLSRDTLGYEVKQTLLVHANELNADHFDKVIEMYRRRGYRFITLQEALKDPAYNLPDRYTGPVGISWLQRWAITKGGEMRPEPGLPETMREFDDNASSGSAFKTGKSR